MENVIVSKQTFSSKILCRKQFSFFSPLHWSFFTSSDSFLSQFSRSLLFPSGFPSPLLFPASLPPAASPRSSLAISPPRHPMVPYRCFTLFKKCSISSVPMTELQFLRFISINRKYLLKTPTRESNTNGIPEQLQWDANGEPPFPPVFYLFWKKRSPSLSICFLNPSSQLRKRSNVRGKHWPQGRLALGRKKSAGNSEEPAATRLNGAEEHLRDVLLIWF